MLLEATISFDIATFFSLLEPFQNVHLALADPVLGTYTFINFHKIFYLHNLFIPSKGLFWLDVLVHQVVLGLSISLFLNQFDFETLSRVLNVVLK